MGKNQHILMVYPRLNYAVDTLFADKLGRKQRDCNCLVPCKRIRYEPNLSYAQLSRVNVDTFVTSKDSNLRDQLQVILRSNLSVYYPQKLIAIISYHYFIILFLISECWKMLKFHVNVHVIFFTINLYIDSKCKKDILQYIGAFPKWKGNQWTKHHQEICKFKDYVSYFILIQKKISKNI